VFLRIVYPLLMLYSCKSSSSARCIVLPLNRVPPRTYWVFFPSGFNLSIKSETPDFIIKLGSTGWSLLFSKHGTGLRIILVMGRRGSWRQVLSSPESKWGYCSCELPSLINFSTGHYRRISSSRLRNSLSFLCKTHISLSSLDRIEDYFCGSLSPLTFLTSMKPWLYSCVRCLLKEFDFCYSFGKSWFSAVSCAFLLRYSLRRYNLLSSSSALSLNSSILLPKISSC